MGIYPSMVWKYLKFHPPLSFQKTCIFCQNRDVGVWSSQHFNAVFRVLWGGDVPGATDERTRMGTNRGRVIARGYAVGKNGKCQSEGMSARVTSLPPPLVCPLVPSYCCHPLLPPPRHTIFFRWTTFLSTPHPPCPSLGWGGTRTTGIINRAGDIRHARHRRVRHLCCGVFVWCALVLWVLTSLITSRLIFIHVWKSDVRLFDSQQTNLFFRSMT